MRKYFAEFIGTFVLVFLGTGTVAIANTGETAIGYLGIGLAFGLAVTIMACAVGGVSGGHFNPVVSLAMMINKRLDGQTDFPNITAGEAFLFEAIITFLFVFVILMVTSEKYGNAALAPVAIGLALAFLIIVALNLTGGSLNPARSFGPAVFAGGTALSHYWVYLLAPLVGAAIAAVAAKLMGSEE